MSKFVLTLVRMDGLTTGREYLADIPENKMNGPLALEKTRDSFCDILNTNQSKNCQTRSKNCAG